MPTDSRTYVEAELRELISLYLQKTEGRSVASVTFNFDRPAHPSPTDPGSGVSARVVFAEGRKPLGDVQVQSFATTSLRPCSDGCSYRPSVDAGSGCTDHPC